jgi:amino acid adenylation domain-containing protein
VSRAFAGNDRRHLGTLKAGGAYVPIDPAYPADRVAFMLEDANAPVLLTQEVLRKQLPPTPAKVICLDSGWEIIERESKAAPASSVTADNLAYVIYTSGSTGRPKGVMNTHRGIVNQLLWARDEFQLAAHDALMQKTPFSFDISVWEFFCPLLAGARLIFARPDGHRDNQYLIRLIISQQITTLQFVPSMLRHFLHEAEVGNCSSLRQVISAGETLPWDLQEAFFKRLPGVSLHNLYGPTEAAVYATHWNCKPDSGRRVVPIGRPIANIQIYILNEARQPVPVGVAGELHIGGLGLARGYLNRPELTAERFIPHPFSDKPDARLYRTGDLARWLPDGNIEFLGRMDQQVKIRGFRIELGEIESVLCQHPALSAGAVTAQPDGVNEMELAAFVIVRDASALTVNSLRSWLGEKLPDYMIPSRFAAVSALPLNANGKLDRKALAKLDGAELAPGTNYAAPRNELERTLAEIWQTVFRRERVGIRDNFFELGGHSLLAALIGSRINRQLGIDVPLRQILEHATIETLAGQMAFSEGHQQNLRPIEKADRLQPLPMSFGQQGMWLLQQTLPDPATYNEPVAWRLSGRVDGEKIRRALQAIMGRHEVLRTALVMLEGNMVQQVADTKEIPLPWREMNLWAVPAEKKEAALEEQLLAEARQPFDLAQAPLWRAVWIQLAEDEQVLAFTFHHSIVDEWSMRLFFRELEQIYAAGGLAALPELPVQYADYAVWQRRRLTGELLERQRRYWKEQLRDLPPALELPTDKLRKLQPSGRGAIHHFQLTEPVVSGLRKLAREEGTTLFTVMLAAYHVWLHRYTGQTDLIVGTPAANRDRSEVQALLGYFLNPLPIRTQLNGNNSFRAIVRQVRETLLGAFSHADLPFEQMVEVAVKEREAGQQPLVQAMFVLLEEGLSPLRLDHAQCRIIPMETKTSKSDLMLSIQAVGEVWDCQLEYATDLFTADGAAIMARHLAELFRSVAENPQELISRLNLMPEAERRQILVEWNRTERESPQGKCVHQLFEEQAGRTPEAVAVVFGENSLSYRELNLRANRLAHHLRGLGVGPDVLVGLCMERSFEMVVGLLGILKAGGAYVPLDPSLPQQRLAFLIRDAVCAAVITQKSLLPLLTHNPQSGETSPSLIVLDAMAFDSGLEGAENPCPITTPNHLAYVIYTSGSTGQPKGVEMPHRALVNLLHWQRSASGAGSASRTLQFASLGFDVSFQEMFSTWISGGTLVLMSDEIRKDPAALLATINTEKIDRIFLPFVMLEQLAEAAGNQDTLPAALKEVVVAGEQLRIGSAIRRFFDRLPGCRLWNHYGPTESHVVTSHELTGSPSNWPDLPPIGRPLPNCQIYLLDAQRNPVPPGIVGELHIGGACLSRGYRRRPDLTAERFIPNPFSSNSDARLYKTGDLARWLPDGNIEFIGRADHQVKIRGYRVELGEIEARVGRSSRSGVLRRGGAEPRRPRQCSRCFRSQPKTIQLIARVGATGETSSNPDGVRPDGAEPSAGQMHSPVI